MSLRTKLAGLADIMQFDNRLELAVNRAVFRRSINVYVFRGIKFIVDHEAGDANGTRACIVSPMYRQFITSMELSGPTTLLDIGANGGGFPLLLKSLAFDLVNVVCVEMNPNTWSRLVFNLALNFPCVQAKAVNCAVSNERGTVLLRLGRGSTADSLLASNDNAGAHDFEIELRTLDEIVSAHFAGNVIDICKIDIEGAEYAVLMSGDCESLRNARYLLIEIHPRLFGPSRVDGLQRRIASLGFVRLKRVEEIETTIELFANQRFLRGSS